MLHEESELPAVSYGLPLDHDTRPIVELSKELAFRLQCGRHFRDQAIQGRREGPARAAVTSEPPLAVGRRLRDFQRSGDEVRQIVDIGLVQWEKPCRGDAGTSI